MLKDDGVFFYVTFRQPHFQIPLLNLDNLWHIEANVLRSGDSFDYYGYVIKKLDNNAQAINKEFATNQLI